MRFCAVCATDTPRTPPFPVTLPSFQSASCKSERSSWDGSRALMDSWFSAEEPVVISRPVRWNGSFVWSGICLG